jgi:hypothetical protein
MHEKCGGVCGGGTGLFEVSLNKTIQVWSDPEAAKTNREVHPRQSGVVARAAEGSVVSGLRVMRNKECSEGLKNLNCLWVSIGCGGRIGENGHLRIVADGCRCSRILIDSDRERNAY